MTWLKYQWKEEDIIAYFTKQYRYRDAHTGANCNNAESVSPSQLTAHQEHLTESAENNTGEKTVAPLAGLTGT